MGYRELRRKPTPRRQHGSHRHQGDTVTLLPPNPNQQLCCCSYFPPPKKLILSILGTRQTSSGWCPLPPPFI